MWTVTIILLSVIMVHLNAQRYEPPVQEEVSDRILSDLFERLYGPRYKEITVERRWPRNAKSFTNKWQQLGPIWGR